jgi:hypothetical protein
MGDIYHTQDILISPGGADSDLLTKNEKEAFNILCLTQAFMDKNILGHFEAAE